MAYELCLATAGKQVPSGPDWIHEVKHDGYARQQGPSRHHHHPGCEDLGEDEDWLRDISIEMEIEDGVIWVYGVDKTVFRRSPTSESRT